VCPKDEQKQLETPTRTDQTGANIAKIRVKTD
jgi:hypothetical protein